MLETAGGMVLAICKTHTTTESLIIIRPVTRFVIIVNLRRDDQIDIPKPYQ